MKACGAQDTGVDLVHVDFAGDHMVAASVSGYAVLTDASEAFAIASVKTNNGTLLIKEFDATVESYAVGVSINEAAIVGQDILRLKASRFATKLGSEDAIDER